MVKISYFLVNLYSIHVEGEMGVVMKVGVPINAISLP